MADVVMHFIIPAQQAPADHMVSGEPAGALPLASKLREKVGHQGQAYRLACNPRLATSERHVGSGEHYALLELVGGQPGISDSACPACINSKEWQEALAKFKESHEGRAHPMQRLPEQVVAKSAGCC